ncbi:MAG: leucine-rich repeat domain-containing protein [Planctomycetia bacterium]
MLKFTRSVVVCVTASFIGLFSVQTAQAIVVDFPDPVMEIAVRSNLGIPAPTPITDADMATMLDFVYYQDIISNIQGIEYAINLNGLFLHFCDLDDISPIASLTNLTQIELGCNHINDISPVSGLTNVYYLFLGYNQISDASAVSGLVNLEELILHDNQIEILNFSGADFPLLNRFNIHENPLREVLLTGMILSQSTFDVLMDGGSSDFGIAKVDGVLRLDMSEIDFVGVSDFSEMYTMDDLEMLSVAGSTNLSGGEVVAWTTELDSLNWLDITGLWSSFSLGEQNALLAWDAIEGNTLVPEPATLTMLFILAVMALLWKKRK